MRSGICHPVDDCITGPLTPRFFSIPRGHAEGIRRIVLGIWAFKGNNRWQTSLFRYKPGWYGQIVNDVVTFEVFRNFGWIRVDISITWTFLKQIRPFQSRMPSNPTLFVRVVDDASTEINTTNLVKLSYKFLKNCFFRERHFGASQSPLFGGCESQPTSVR